MYAGSRVDERAEVGGRFDGQYMVTLVLVLWMC
jgi:hypothetical protein